MKNKINIRLGNRIVRLAKIRLDSTFTTINPIILDVHYIK